MERSLRGRAAALAWREWMRKRDHASYNHAQTWGSSRGLPELGVLMSVSVPLTWRSVEALVTPGYFVNLVGGVWRGCGTHCGPGSERCPDGGAVRGDRTEGEAGLRARV